MCVRERGGWRRMREREREGEREREREKRERGERKKRKGKAINLSGINTTPYSALQDGCPFISKHIGITIHTVQVVLQNDEY